MKFDALRLRLDELAVELVELPVDTGLDDPTAVVVMHWVSERA
jgi:hypothetical protein